jgi:predicted permease
VSAFAYPALVEVYRNQTSMEQVAMLSFGQDVLTSHASQPTLDLGFVTPQWFSLVAAPLLMGRVFDETQGLGSNVPVAVISYQTWQQVFDGDRAILDKTVDFTGVSYKVIGVLAEQFVDPQLYQRGTSTQVWLPWDHNLNIWRNRNWVGLVPDLMLVGKLPLDKSIAQVTQAMDANLNNLWLPQTSYSKRFDGVKLNAKLMSFSSHILGDVANALMLLIIGALGLVLIATVNIANLFMSRTAEQQRPLAIRAAVGATPGKLFKTLLAESSLLMICSMVLALPLAIAGFSILQTYMADIFPRLDELSLRPITLLIALVTVVVFALVFAWMGSRTINYRALNLTLQSSGKGAGVQVSQKVRTSLIFIQVALASILIFANVLLFNEAYSKIKQPLGFKLDHISRLNLSFSGGSWPPVKELTPIMDELSQELQALPSVAKVSRSYSPMSRFSVDNMEDLATNQRFFVEYKTVAYDYFSMIEQPLIAGDSFSEQQYRQHDRVMVINDKFAKVLAPNGSALGLQVKGRSKRAYTVVGVVKGIVIPGKSNVPMRAYVPASTGLGSAMIQLNLDQHLTRETMVKVLQKVDGRFTVGRLDSLKALQDKQLFPQYMTVVATAVLALLSLFTAAVGLYGILSYSTEMRRTELGTRMAVGATKAHLVKLILTDNSFPVIGGLAFGGILLSIVYLMKFSWLMPYVGAGMVVIYIGTLLSIALITFGACYLPLTRYVNRPAIHALRGE